MRTQKQQYEDTYKRVNTYAYIYIYTHTQVGLEDGGHLVAHAYATYACACLRVIRIRIHIYAQVGLEDGGHLVV